MTVKPNVHIIEHQGEDALALVKENIESLSLSNVTRIRVEIEADDPITKRTDTQPSEEPEPEPREEPDKELGSSFVDVSVYPGGDTFHALDTLYELDDFVESSIIVQQSPQFNEGDSLSNMLWNQVERGLVEKKTHPRDGRKNVYKITGKGRKAVEAARGRK